MAVLRLARSAALVAAVLFAMTSATIGMTRVLRGKEKISSYIVEVGESSHADPALHDDVTHRLPRNEDELLSTAECPLGPPVVRNTQPVEQSPRRTALNPLAEPWRPPAGTDYALVKTRLGLSQVIPLRHNPWDAQLIATPPTALGPRSLAGLPKTSRPLPWSVRRTQLAFANPHRSIPRGPRYFSEGKR